ncbi:hypothetical protein BpHYR1_031864 [Brachionus plicatilis]|uniref:Uncharacterized protein n=1 Tax=Brachionus plicatilis TaxID=10195 RepID=A0A3M7SHB9_BRAPC|nr:hypothetical protein BpHYR1_031864 [Brachionus plicatilis]
MPTYEEQETAVVRRRDRPKGHIKLFQLKVPKIWHFCSYEFFENFLSNSTKFRNGQTNLVSILQGNKNQKK